MAWPEMLLKVVGPGWAQREGRTEEYGKEKQEHPMGWSREEASRGQNSFTEGGIHLVYTEGLRWASGTKADGAGH